MADLLIRVKVYCTCGFPLEEVEAGDSKGLGWFTVKPCRACTQAKNIKKTHNKSQADYVYPENDNGPFGATRRGD